MRIFFDTCTLVDYLCNRQNAPIVEHILEYSEENQWQCYISVGSFYTLVYLLELHLKRTGYSDKDERIAKLREILLAVLETFSVSDIYSEELKHSVTDDSFSDLEDSCQYRAALAAECDYLITINIHDFKDADMTELSIMTPSDFNSQVLSNHPR